MDIGIDLGTTFSVIAVNGRVDLAPGYPGGIYLETCDVTIIPTPYGEQTFPSVVLEDPDRRNDYLFGSDALQKAEDGYAPVMFSKRRIGTREVIPTLSGPVLAKDVASRFLRYLKQCAEQALGGPMRRAVVTHPAYFDRGAVEETREAAREAGFDMSLPEQMLMEPVAAALAYTRTDKRDPLRVLTYDLGGGTFDVTFLVRNSGVISMRGFDGDHLLGGYNFDRRLVHWVQQQLKNRGRTIVFDEANMEDRARLLRLLRIAEQVKIELAKAPTDSTMVEFRARGVALDADHKDVQISERLSRSQFVSMIQPDLEGTLEACRRTLEKANVGIDEVDEVLLVGGSTWAPWIASAVRTAFPGVTPRLFFPDLCVGAGAAIHAKMILPRVIVDNRYTLVLDVPDIAVISTLNIAGKILDSAKLAEPLTVELHPSDGSAASLMPLNVDGQFVFPDIELITGGIPTRFFLKVRNRAGTVVMEHPFEITYAPESTETSSVTTVLPKPLSIETFEGLVELAEEGSPLPAKCSRTFERQNDNPGISLKLFQGRDPIGEVRIENIPREGGRGSLVELVVEVTETNQIRGTAKILTPSGRAAVEAPVRVQFERQEVPSVEALRQMLGDLDDQLSSFAKNDKPNDDLRVRCTTLLEEIERLFAQQPIERQEVHAAIRQLRSLLKPPPDDMKPTLAEFLKMMEDCRNLVVETELHAKAVLSQAQHDKAGAALDPATLTNAKKALSRVGQHRAVIDRQEHDGIEAHRRRDHKSWARIFSVLSDVKIQLYKRQEMEAPPTIIVKLVVSFEVRRYLSELDIVANRLEDAGRTADWKGELDRIRRRAQEVLKEIEEVGDDLPTDQARAHLQRIYFRSIQPLKEAIDRVGVDISRVIR